MVGAKSRTNTAGLGEMRMSSLLRDHNHIGRIALGLVFVALIISMASGAKAEGGAAAKEAIRTFASPQAAGDALVKTAKSGDHAALLEIFGPEGKEILFSGNAGLDQAALKDFATAYDTMHRWGEIAAGGEMLYVGAENFPFPIPLEKNASGQWYFNTANGADEILARRIGRNELVAMAALGGLANAEHQYFGENQEGQKVQQYARKFVSDEGQHNGLYWPASEGEAESPLGQMGDFAEGAGYTNPGEAPRPFSGYNFQILTKQGKSAKGGAKDYVENGNLTGGFAILAYPSEYRNSGIMTFLIGTDGVLYEKDLGEKTSEVAQSITEYDPGEGWHPVNR
jgi:hypothetical protein